MKGNFFVVDAETDGIYGKVLSIAAKAVDSGSEAARFYGAVNVTRSDVASEWVKENVLSHLKNADVIYPDENQLLEAFWAFYSQHGKDRDVIADVPYPVETGIFRRCILENPGEREPLSPFPIYDLESMLYSAGYGRLTDRNILSGLNCVRHDAMNDVNMTTKILEDKL